MRLTTYTDVFPTIPGPLRPTDPIFVKLNSLKVEDIYKYQVAKFVFKCLNQITAVQFHDWYKLNHQIHGYYTRFNFNVNDGIIINNLFVPSACTSNYGLKQLKVNGPRIWNELPASLKNASCLNIFLKNLNVLYFKIFINSNHYNVHVLYFHSPTCHCFAVSLKFLKNYFIFSYYYFFFFN